MFLTKIFVYNFYQVSSEIFPPNTGGAEKMAKDMSIPFLGKLPLNPEIGKAYLFPYLLNKYIQNENI